MKAPGSDLLAYHRKLALSQIPLDSIYKPGYIDSLHQAANGKVVEDDEQDTEV